MRRLKCIKPGLKTISTGRIINRPSYGQGRTGNWRTLRAKVLERDEYLCRCDACSASSDPLPAHEVDHIVPLSQGGKDNPENLRAINRDCHRIKTAAESAAGRDFRTGMQ